MEKRVLTRITTISGYPEIQVWSDGSITYNKGNEYVPLTDSEVILKIVNKMRDIPEELSINNLEEYIGDRSDDPFLKKLLEQMKEKDKINDIIELGKQEGEEQEL